MQLQNQEQSFLKVHRYTAYIIIIFVFSWVGEWVGGRGGGSNLAFIFCSRVYWPQNDKALFRNQLRGCSAAAAATLWHWQHLKRLMADMSLRCAAWITHRQMCLHAKLHSQSLMHDTTWGLRSFRPKQSSHTEGRQHQSFSPFLDNTSWSGPVWEPV